MLNDGSIKFDEMTAKHMVEKLLIVSTDAEKIWAEFDTQYPGFFTKVLMKTYNIGEGFHRHMINEYKAEVAKLDQAVKDRIDEMRLVYQTKEKKL